MELIVKGCSDCPMFNNGANFEYEAICQHPAAPNQFYEPLYPKKEVFRIEIESSGEDLSYIEWPVTPDWCPIVKEPITISKK